MTKIVLLLVLFVVSAHAETAVDPTVQSAGQAVVRFHEALGGELKTLLSVEKYQWVISMSKSKYLHVRRFMPQAFQHSSLSPASSNPELVFLGTFASVTGCKNDTWIVNYVGDFGHLNAYLDATTGRVLYICYRAVE